MSNCKDCQTVIQKGTRYGRRCEACHKIHIKQYNADLYTNNADKIKNSVDVYRKANKDKVNALQNKQSRKPARRFSHAQGMAKQRNISWTLELADFLSLIDEPCFYCQNQLGAPVETGSGLDRLDSAVGYQLGNVVSCCQHCNQIKMDLLTPEETIAAVDAILTVRKKSTPISTILMGDKYPTNLRSNKEIKEIFGKSVFTYAKPLQLIKNLMKIVSKEGDVVLDIFGGSGTTGQAAFELKREFILCQLDEGGIPDLIKQRLDKTIGKENYEVIDVSPNVPLAAQVNSAV
jgi:DNA methylase